MTHRLADFDGRFFELLVLAGLVVLAGSCWAEEQPPADAASQDAYAPAAAYGESTFLVAWQSGRIAPGDLRNGLRCSGDIVVCRVDDSGKLLDTKPLVVCSAGDMQAKPRVAFGGGTYLVVWQDLRGGKDWDVYAARVSPAGEVLDAGGFLISGGQYNQAKPRVVWDGESFLVVWQDFRSGDNYAVYSARVSAEGNVLDAQGAKIASGDFYHCYAPEVASDRSGNSIVLHIAVGLPVTTHRAPLVQGWLVADGKSQPKPAYVFDKQMPNARHHGPGRRGHPISMAAGGGGYLAAWKNDTRAGRGSGPRASNAALFNEQGARLANLSLEGVDDKRLDRTGHIMDPAVVWDGSQFVVAWYEYVRQSPGACPSDVIFAARIAASGNGKGTPRRIAGELAAPASAPTLATDGAGKTLIAYQQHPATADVPIRIAIGLLSDKAPAPPIVLAPAEVRPAEELPRQAEADGEATKPQQFAIPVWHPDVRWRAEPLAGCGADGHLDGPRLEMESWSTGIMSPLCATRGAGRYVYSSYDPATQRAHEAAGTAQGYLDGPFSRARFGGWDYVVRSRGARSPDGRFLFRTDGYNQHAVRCLDLQAQTVTTLLPRADGVRGLAAGRRRVLLLDQDGQITFVTAEGVAEPGPQVDMQEKVHRWGASLALDEKHGHIYATTYGAENYYVWYWDLADGSFHGVLPTPAKSGKDRGRNVPGPFAGTNLYKEGTVFFGPDDPEKRFLYVGRVDTWNLFRLDLERRMIAALDKQGGRRGEPTIVWFSEEKYGGRVPCYARAAWAADGSFQSTVHSPYVTWQFKRIQ